MGTGITGEPNSYDFGYEFNYAVWTADTEITLTNVPWNNDYRDVVWFESTNALNAFIDANEATNTRISNMSYAKVTEPIQVDIPFNMASRFNYVRVFNPAQPVVPSDAPRYYYYFVTNVRYIAPNNTEITVQLDVWQTYVRNVQFGRCYIDRGHVGIANEHNFRNYGRDYLTIPEGIDTGNEYAIVSQRSRNIMHTGRPGGYDVLVASVTKLEAAPGTVDHPNLVSATGALIQGMPSGAQYYLFTDSNQFFAFLTEYRDKPWVTQGIISVTLIPKISRYGASPGAPLGNTGAVLPPSMGLNRVQHDYWENWRESSTIRNYLPPRYRHLRKFYTYPYMVIEATSNTGTPLILKPEAWNNPDASIREMAGIVPPNQRLSFSPIGYNSLNDGGNILGTAEEYLDMQSIVGNFPTMAIVNDGAISYMASNARSTAYAHRAADWAQQRALRGNEVSYDQATTGANAARDVAVWNDQAAALQQGISNQLASDNALFGALGNIGVGAGAGALAGPVAALGGAAMAGVHGVLNQQATNRQIAAANDSYAVRTSHNQRVADQQQNVSNYMRDTNKGLADWAARGDYENTIAGLNAKTQDAQLTQPTTSGQVGGEAFNFSNGEMNFVLKWKMIDQASVNVIGEYWLRYGYAVKRFGFLPPDLSVMSHFTYWKLSETYIRAGAMPESFKQVIRGILEKGVTVWRNPDDMGVIDPAINQPIPGIVIDGYEPPAVTPEPEPEPETRNRKKRKMLVFTTDDNGRLWALAGSSPGTPANWVETGNAVLGAQFLTACGVETAVEVSPSDFYAYKADYQAVLLVEDTSA